ncbi:MAG: urease accessory protein UreH domain-containing protein [Planctomycetota bacterium]|jgi:sulfite exporter TauE/SafE
MWSHLATGFIIGLSAGLGCLATCVPLFLSVSTEGMAESRASGIKSLLKLLAGRLLGYIGFGLALGIVGETFLPEDVNLVPFFGIAYLILSALLIIYGLGFSKESKLCAAMGLAGRKIQSPFLIGLLTGFSICSPFLAVSTEALISKSIFTSVLIYAVFFLGTSLYVLPFFVVPLANKTKFADAFKRIGQTAAFATALWFFISGISYFAPVLETWEPPYPAEPDLSIVEPGADRFEFHKAPRRKWQAIRTEKNEMGFPRQNHLGTIYYSNDTFSEGKAPEGYAGPVPVIVSLDSTGKIRGLSIHDNIETGGYLARLTPEFLRSLVGKPYTDPFEIEKDIDAITGATKTLEAFTASLRETVKQAAATDLGLPPPPVAGISSGISYAWSIFTIIALASCAIIVCLCSLRKWRYIVLALTVVILGFIFRAFLHLGVILGLLLNQATDLSPQFITFCIVALVTAFFFGRFYCGYLCPFGALSELISKIPTPKIALSHSEDEFFRPAKYVVLAALITFFLFTHNPNVFLLEPFTITFSAPGQLSLMWSDSAMLVVFAVLMLLINLIVPRFWCRYLCPTGAILAILSLLRIRFGEKEKSACRRCGNQGFGRRHECFNCIPAEYREKPDET